MASRGTMAWAARALTLAIMVSLGACGDDDGGGDGDAGDGESGSGGGGMSGGSGGAGGSRAGTGGGGAGSGGSMAMATCDDTIPTTATCGGMECPASTSPLATATCTVPCCTANDECGLRNAIQGAATACAGPAEEDPNCPGYSGMAMGMPVELPGCCHSSGVCGAISSLSMSCIISSMFLPDLMAGDPCGDGSGDGGN